MTESNADLIPYAIQQKRDGSGRAFVLDRKTGASVGYVERTVWESVAIWDAYAGSRGTYRNVGHRTTRKDAAELLWRTTQESNDGSIT